jgi:hypothetical protein
VLLGFRRQRLHGWFAFGGLESGLARTRFEPISPVNGYAKRLQAHKERQAVKREIQEQAE